MYLIWVSRTTLTTGWMSSDQPAGRRYPNTTINIDKAARFDSAEKALSSEMFDAVATVLWQTELPSR